MSEQNPAPTINVTPSTPPPAAPPPASTAPTDWTSGLNDETKGYVQTKGFKDPASVLDSYRNLEKLIGVPKERLLKLPENMQDPAAMKEIYSRLGQPSTADEYGIQVPKDAGTEQDFAKWAKQTFFDLGLTKTQAQSLAGKWNEYFQAGVKAESDAFAAKALEQEQGLRKEWGMAYEQNVAVAQRAAKAFGLDAQTVDQLEQAMGFGALMKFMHTIGSKVGEAPYIDGGSRGGGFGGAMTPEQAKNQIAALKADNDYVKRFLNGDVSAKKEMDRLHQMAYPQQN